MSSATITAPTPAKRSDPEKTHRIRLRLFAALAITLVLSLLIQGFTYYRLPLQARPDSPLHDKLKPSGTIGVKLGILGTFIFCCIFLYPLRKRWTWLMRQGNSRHWLDFHIVMGLSAPFIIACHASFKFRGFAGLAFWIMTAVVLSGVVGRYLYGQIPRRKNAAELSMKEAQDLQEHLVHELASQRYFSQKQLAPLFKLPSREQAERLPAVVSLVYMMFLDMQRPFHVARLRMRSLTPLEYITSLGGFLHTRHAETEIIIDLARAQATLSKRIIFYSRAQQIFHLWHVIHKPFSFTFVVLALIHISVVILLGFA